MASSFAIFQIKDTQIVDTGRFEKLSNKDQNDGYPALSSTGDVLGKGRFLFLTRDTYNRIYLGERTSGEHCFVLQRNGAYDYQNYIVKGGSEVEMATKPIRNTDLSTATGRITGQFTPSRTININLGTEYAFFPNILTNYLFVTMKASTYQDEITDEIARFTIESDQASSTYYWVRWRYISSSLPALVVVYDNKHIVTLSEIDDEKTINTEFVEAVDDTGKKINMKKEIIYPVTLDNINIIIQQLKNINVDISHLKTELIELEERKSKWVSSSMTK